MPDNKPIEQLCEFKYLNNLISSQGGRHVQGMHGRDERVTQSFGSELGARPCQEWEVGDGIIT